MLEKAPDGGEMQRRGRAAAAVPGERGILIPFSGALPTWCRCALRYVTEGPEVFPHFPEVAAGSTWAAAMADTDPAAAAAAAVRFKSK